MKKILLTLALGLGLLTANAQWVITTSLNRVTTIAGEGVLPGEVYEGDVCPGTVTNTINITDNLGIGYQVNDKITIGINRLGEHKVGKQTTNEEYYYWSNLSVEYIVNTTSTGSTFIVCEYDYLHATTDNDVDHLDIGVGYSVQLWEHLYFEPNYTKSMKEGSQGTLNIEFSYKL